MESVIETYLGGVQNGVVAAVTAVTSGAVTSAVVNGASVAVGSVTSPVEPDDIPKSTKSPVWILGRQYCAAQELDQIRSDVQSRLWCTYRKGFAPIGQAGYTSDRGWGCMLRCGQMILAQALIDLHLGRDWFWTPECRDPTYLQIVKRFEDNRQNPYSIHTIALMGDSEDKRVGEWFGPNTVSQVLKKLVVYDEWSQLLIHVALDNMVILDEILNLCVDIVDPLSWRPLMLIVPLRLGITEVNPIYVAGLKRFFQLPGNVGMIGGRPNQALYFIGHVDDEALYLDPHTTQPAGQAVGDKSTEAEQQADAMFHQRHAGRIAFAAMDPSVALAFVCRTRQEFDALCADLRRLQVVGGGGGGADIAEAERIQPLFELAQSAYQPWVASALASNAKRRTSSVRTNDEFVTVEQAADAGTVVDDVAERSKEDADNDDGDDSDAEFEFIA